MNSNRLNTDPHAQAHQTIEEVLSQAKNLIDELEPLKRAEAQLPAKLISLVSIVTAFCLFMIASYGYLLELNEVPSPTASFLSVGVLATISFYLWKHQSLSKEVSLSITLAILVLTCITVWFNGVYPLYFLPAIILFLHITVPPQLALPASILVLGGAALVFLSHGNEIEFRVATRMLSAGLICLASLQALTRNNLRVTQTASYVMNGLQSLAYRLESDLKNTEKERDLAKRTDSDSGLLNLSGFHEKLAEEIQRSSVNQPFAVISIRFPSSGLMLNSEMFHESEKVLSVLIARMKSLFLPDLIGRSSKWEFIGVIKIGQSHEEFLESLNKQLKALSASLPLDAGLASLSFYAGVVCWPSMGLTAQDLSSRANKAMLYAHNMNLNKQALWFSQDIEELISNKKDLVRSVDHAFEHHEFELYYQPIVSLKDNAVFKSEALVRWNHPERGLLFPGSFLSLLESQGFMIQLTELCLKDAAQTARKWRASLHPQFEISVNIPPSYLIWGAQHRQETLAFFQSLDTPEGAIKLEITEDSLLDVSDDILELLSALKEIGFRLALDDFGTGYSSFGRLESLPLDAIKIDKVLIDRIEDSAQKLRVCSAIIHLGHEFQFDVVAEGIEHSKQKQLLEEAGCDYIQGYLYSKPLTQAKFESFCANF